MSKTRILFIVGVLIAVLPYLGFPYLWKNVFFTLLGLGIALSAYIQHRESKKVNTVKKTFENFKENGSFGENEIKMEEPKLE